MKKYLTHLLIFALILSVSGNVYYFLTDVNNNSDNKCNEEDCDNIVEKEYIYQDSSILKEMATSIYNNIHTAMYNNSAPNSVDLIYSNNTLTNEYKNLLAFGSLYSELNKTNCKEDNCLSYSVNLSDFEIVYKDMFGTDSYSKNDFYGDKTNTCKFEDDKVNCYYNSLLENWDVSDGNPYFESYVINQLSSISIENNYVIISEKHLDVVIIEDEIDISILDSNTENMLDKYIDDIKSNTLTDTEIDNIINDNISKVEEYEFYFKINDDGSLYLDKVVKL